MSPSRPWTIIYHLADHGRTWGAMSIRFQQQYVPAYDVFYQTASSIVRSEAYSTRAMGSLASVLLLSMFYPLTMATLAFHYSLLNAGGQAQKGIPFAFWRSCRALWRPPAALLWPNTASSWSKRPVWPPASGASSSSGWPLETGLISFAWRERPNAPAHTDQCMCGLHATQ